MSIRMFESHTGKEVPITFSTFPGGEEHVRIEEPLTEGSYIIQARLTSSVWVMRLVMLDDAFMRANKNAKYVLQLPYLPYARQDRVCNTGESLAIEAFVDRLLVILMGCWLIRVVDVHSQAATEVVTTTLPSVQMRQIDILVQWEEFFNFTQKNKCVLVAPDKGALHKTVLAADTLWLDMVVANKVRDPLTTKIIGTEVEDEIDPDRHYMIIDDICDGGRTFVELAKVLKAKGAKHLHLYVTHGIFSAGFEELSKYFDTIWTTNSFTDRRPMVYRDTEIFTFDIFSIM